jgi:two-component system response regulator PilR (NtrC family)
VHGESGTGKELVASAIHACSHRSGGPFVAVNCGAIPENLLEAEFFGAKKGSYTGSSQDRDGYFQTAQNGTLFLDEIGDLPLTMQSKLLRAIQERRIRSIGSTSEDLVDVRIVSATHKDLAVEVQEGRFRQDLYYRLNVIEIAIPPLRDRRTDLPALCTALLAKIAAETGNVAPTPSPRLLDQLSRLALKGNVRELENLLHRALALHEGDVLELDGEDHDFDESKPALPQSDPAFIATNFEVNSDAHSVLPEDLQAFLDAKEREILVKVLEETNFNRTAAAARLKLSLRQMRYRIARLNISLPDGSADDHASEDGVA